MTFAHLIIDPVDVDIIALLYGGAAEEVQGGPGCETVGAVVEGLESLAVGVSRHERGGHS